MEEVNTDIMNRETVSASIVKDEAVLFSDYSPDLFFKREEEEKILSILKPIAERKRCGNIFLYGSSGCGKTPLAKYVLDKIKQLNPRIHCIYINCWYHDTSMAIYAKIADSLGEVVSRRGRASDEIFERIIECMRREGTPVLITLDEIDGLISKGETKILHNLSRLGNNGIRFGVMGVSVNKNILSRVCPRIVDSLRFNYLELKNYTKEQLLNIIRKKAQEGLNQESYNESILEKIALICYENEGNGRLVIELLRKSAIKAENRGKEQITFEEIEEVAYKLFYFKNPKLSREEQIIVKILKRGEMRSSELYWLFCKELIKSRRQIRNYVRKLELKGIIEIREEPLKNGRTFMIIKLKNWR